MKKIKYCLSFLYFFVLLGCNTPAKEQNKENGILKFLVGKYYYVYSEKVYNNNVLNGIELSILRDRDSLYSYTIRKTTIDTANKIMPETTNYSGDFSDKLDGQNRLYLNRYVQENKEVKYYIQVPTIGFKESPEELIIYEIGGIATTFKKMQKPNKLLFEKLFYVDFVKNFEITSLLSQLKYTRILIRPIGIESIKDELSNELFDSRVDTQCNDYVKELRSGKPIFEINTVYTFIHNRFADAGFTKAQIGASWDYANEYQTYTNHYLLLYNKSKPQLLKSEISTGCKLIRYLLDKKCILNKKEINISELPIEEVIESEKYNLSNEIGIFISKTQWFRNLKYQKEESQFESIKEKEDTILFQERE